MNLIYTPRFYQTYAPDPEPVRECGVVQEYQTLPRDWPRRHELDGPASVAKKLYPSTPNCYGYMYRDVPVGTLYDNDLSAVTVIGAEADSSGFRGVYPKRSTYQPKLRNLDSRSPRALTSDTNVSDWSLL